MLKDKTIVLCPIVELGFLRISSNKKAFNVPMNEARGALEQFALEREGERIADDLPVLESKAEKSEQVTDNYLAELAAKHGFKLVTFDEGLTRQRGADSGQSTLRHCVSSELVISNFFDYSAGTLPRKRISPASRTPAGNAPKD